MLTPWGECAVGDAHIHFFSCRFFETLGAQCNKTAEETAAALDWEFPPPDPAGLAERWTAELDAHGVSRAAIIGSVPGDEVSVATARRAYPDRFYAYAMVNAAVGGVAVSAGLDAICLFPAMHGYSMQDPRVEPLLDQAAAEHWAIFVHCGVLTVGVRKKLGLPSPFDMRFSNPIDLHAVALRHPKIPFIIPHFGAGYFREALMLADLCPNIYLDTSSSNSWTRYEGLDLATVFRRALDVAGASRLLFGTDSSFFPRGWQRPVYEAQIAALERVGVSAADARLILGENLQRIMTL
jgi:uncharacterized protein